jgi:hypothetical protein
VLQASMDLAICILVKTLYHKIAFLSNRLCGRSLERTSPEPAQMAHWLYVPASGEEGRRMKRLKCLRDVACGVSLQGEAMSGLC